MSKNVQTAIDWTGDLDVTQTICINLDSGWWVRMCPRYVRGKVRDYVTFLYRETTIMLVNGDFVSTRQEAEAWGKEKQNEFGG